MEKISRRFLVKGRVQGVGFRWFVVDAAQGLALAGWTRNLRDGSVEVLAQGERSAVEELRDVLAQGPRAARVDSVTWDDVEPDAAIQGFSVRH